MRKGFLSLLLLAAAILPAAAQSNQKNLTVSVRAAATPAAATATVSSYSIYAFNWTYTPNLPACVSTTTACYDGFIMTNTTTGKAVGTPSQIGPTLTSWNYTPVGGVPYGTAAFSLVAHGYNALGAELLSGPATVSITVDVTSLNGPTGLQVKTQ